MTVVKINAITVSADSGMSLPRFAARADTVDKRDGFEGFEFLNAD
jgi:heme-degrading monooxygenase HmoA